MKCVISKSDLAELAGKIQNIVSLKPTLPILSNLLIEAVNDELILTATDLTVGMRCYTNAKILEEGTTTIPARRFLQLIRELPNITLEMTSHPNEVTEIVAGSSRFKLNGMRKEDFPHLPDLNGAVKIQIPQEALREALFQTSFAVSKEDTRHVLTGVYLHIVNGKATFVGTDGKRLAKATTAPLSIDHGFTGGAIIPLKAIDEIQKVLKEEGEATLFLMSDKIALEANQATIITKLLTGEYPDYHRVIPEKTEISIQLHREELIACLRQVSLFTSEQSHSVRFAFSQGELILSANSTDIGEGKVSLPINYAGSPFQIAFHPGFFLDILRHSKDETINLGLTDPYNPGMITDSSSALFIIMPMRLYEAPS